MGTITYSIPINGQPNSTEDPKIATALTTLLSFANGGIDKGNLAANSGIMKLASLSNRVIAFGVIGLPWSGGLYSSSVTVAHGLGTTPVFAVASLNFADAWASVVGTPDATNLQILGRAPSGTLSGTPSCWWLAIG